MMYREPMFTRRLGIFGWKEADENLVLASLLTGDPLLLIGNHGCAKTYVANKVAQALGRKFLGYDAPKVMFEDVLRYPTAAPAPGLGSDAHFREDGAPSWRSSTAASEVSTSRDASPLEFRQEARPELHAPTLRPEQCRKGP